MKINLKSESEIISSSYFDTGVKPWDADILRCEELKNLPELRVNQDNFDGVMKVCKRYTWKQICENAKINFSSSQAMRSCWDIEPRDRPQFKRLVTSLEALRNDYDYDCS